MVLPRNSSAEPRLITDSPGARRSTSAVVTSSVTRSGSRSSVVSRAARGITAMSCVALLADLWRHTSIPAANAASRSIALVAPLIWSRVRSGGRCTTPSLGVATPSSWVTRCPADCQRSAGFFSRQVMTSAASAGGILARCFVTGSAALVTCAASTAWGLGPVKGGCPSATRTPPRQRHRCRRVIGVRVTHRAPAPCTSECPAPPLRSSGSAGYDSRGDPSPIALPDCEAIRRSNGPQRT